MTLNCNTAFTLRHVSRHLTFLHQTPLPLALPPQQGLHLRDLVLRTSTLLVFPQP
jgi:hypothetical protein